MRNGSCSCEVTYALTQRFVGLGKKIYAKTDLAIMHPAGKFAKEPIAL